jgi:hypothetical protein
LGYWVWLGYPFFKDTLLSYTASPDITEISVPVVQNSLLFIFTNNTDAIVIAFLSIFGIISISRSKRDSFVMGTAFIIFSTLALVLYFPIISNFLSKLFLSARLQLLVTPFIAFVTAGGLLIITKKSLSDWPNLKSMAGVIIFFLSLTATVITANSTDLNSQKILGNENRQYFSTSELDAFSFAQQYGAHGLYFGDYASSIYLKSRLGLTVRQTLDIFQPDSIEKGYMVLREHELQTRGRLGFTIWGQSGSTDQEYTYLAGSSPDLQALWEKENKIFDGGTVYIYMKKTLE